MITSNSYHKQAAALVILLAFLVILSGIVVAYLWRCTADRQLAHATFNQTQADILARSALDLVVGDFKQEITAESVASTVDGYTIFMPRIDANILPTASGTPADRSVPNLVKRSVHTDPASRAAAVNSTSISLNGRSISTAQWNKHYLIPRVSPTPSSDGDTTPIASFEAPDWVLVTRNGPTPAPGWMPSLGDANPTNPSYVTGRYAYAVYDEGGIIDVNVAGYPSPSPSPTNYVKTIGRKGSAPFLDLTQSGMSWGGIGDLVGWRGYASIQPNGGFNNFTFNSAAADRYLTAILSNSNGFTTVSSAVWNNGTDQAFTSRQSLIQFQKSSQFTVGALQYLGTFSRELNRPNWKPAIPSGINPDLQGIRVASTFTRSDGTAAVVGEPLIKARFPLTRMAELSVAGNPYIQRDFGLQWDIADSRWNYVGTTGFAVQSSIETLAQVAGENREPNFFELLKAVILNGTVGLGSGPSATFVASEAKYYNSDGGFSEDYQIVQIGANVIDEWDSDNIPTFINFGSESVVGIENLPYLNKLVFCPSFPVNTDGQFNAWLVPSLWNPHQNAPGTGTIRIVLDGSISYTATGVGKDGSVYVTTTSPPISPLPATMDVDAASFGITPSPPTNVLASTSSVTNTGPPETFYGFHYPFSSSTENVNQVTQLNADSAYPDFGGAVGTATVELQIQIPGTSSFVPYQTWRIAAPLGHPLLLQGPKGNFLNGSKLQDPEFVSLDPRTMRFGIWGSAAANQSGSGSTTKDLNQGAKDSLDQQGPANRLQQVSLYQPQGPLFTVGNLANLSWYSANNQPTTFYKDLDGIQRYADFTTNDGITNGNTIMYPIVPGSNDRSRIFSSPFQSVSELGQVFRDQPWKTLNFTTNNSGDVGLLDAFTLQDVAKTSGRFSLNTRQLIVLKAALSKTASRLDGSVLLNPTQVASLANDIAAVTAANPVQNKADLVARLATTPSFTGLGNKEAREAVVRALSDTTQTRTWVLMIDMIAQSGRYPPAATDLSQFIVEGEKRYWLHVAIDRFTGEVIAQQLEAVYE